MLACAGDVPTMETLAAAELLRAHAPELQVRFVNVVDLMALFPPDDHPHGMDELDVRRALHRRTPTWSFAFHGYPRAVHQLLHGRADAGRFHVRGYREQGTTTTPFDMVVRNEMSRYHLAIEALDRRARRRARAPTSCASTARPSWIATSATSPTHLEDLPEIRDWRWPST